MKARIYITFKQGVLEPQGKAVKNSLHSLGFDSVDEVRVGKLVDIRLQGGDKAASEKEVADMCDRLLTNPVIEDYTFEISEDQE